MNKECSNKQNSTLIKNFSFLANQKTPKDPRPKHDPEKFPKLKAVLKINYLIHLVNINTWKPFPRQALFKF